MVKKKNNLVESAKDVVKVGIVGGVGMGVMGAMAPMAQGSGQVVQATGAGLGLVATGAMAKAGMGVVGMFAEQTPKKKTGDKRIDRMLGL